MRRKSFSIGFCALLIGSLTVTGAFGQNALETKPLSSAEIGHSLVGKQVSYSPPGWADAGIVEAFHEGGKWLGTYLSRGPVSFSGRWSVEDDQLCVVADRGTVAQKWHAGKYCRQVLENKRTKKLLLDHVNGMPGVGPQILSVRNLNILK